MIISGIQQIGIGVSQVHPAFKWYRENLGFDIPIFEEAATAGLMLPYTGGEPRSRHAILALNLQGGGGLEIWQYTERTPQPPQHPVRLGDLGIGIAKIKCKDVKACHDDLRARGVQIRTSPSARPDGRLHFYLDDPWGNTFEIVSAEDWSSKKRPIHTGGVCGAQIGVSDMDRSIRFYREVLGYDVVVYDANGEFADWHGLEGGLGRYRRVLLRHSRKPQGPFSPIFGHTEIELVQALDHPPRRIFDGRFWGDLGFIHLCFDVSGMAQLKTFCAEKGHPFTVDSSGSFDMGEAAGYFAYIEDPDGTLIEFVETHKIPIVKKIGWYLDLRKRANPAKPLPAMMLTLLGLGRVK